MHAGKPVACNKELLHRILQQEKVHMGFSLDWGLAGLYCIDLGQLSSV